MSLSDLASLGSFVSALAVVVSLIFLAVQMRQNTEAVRASAALAHENQTHELVAAIVGRDDVAELFRTGLQGPEQLNHNQRVRFLVLMSGLFRYYHASFLEHKQARVDDGLWYLLEQQCRDFVKQPGFQDFWDMRRHWHTPDFRAWVDALPKPRPERGLYDRPAKAG